MQMTSKQRGKTWNRGKCMRKEIKTKIAQKMSKAIVARSRGYPTPSLNNHNPSNSCRSKRPFKTSKLRIKLNPSSQFHKMTIQLKNRQTTTANLMVSKKKNQRAHPASRPSRIKLKSTRSKRTVPRARMMTQSMKMRNRIKMNAKMIKTRNKPNGTYKSRNAQKGSIRS